MDDRLGYSEVVFILSNTRTYNVSRPSIRDHVLPLIGLTAIKLPHKKLYSRIFALYTDDAIDFVDAYHVALMAARNDPELYSYDHHFDRIPRVRRIEP